MTEYEPSICHRYGSTSHGCKDVDDEGMDGLYDEGPQRAGI